MDRLWSWTLSWFVSPATTVPATVPVSVTTDEQEGDDFVCVHTRAFCGLSKDEIFRSRFEHTDKYARHSFGTQRAPPVQETEIRLPDPRVLIAVAPDPRFLKIMAERRQRIDQDS